MFTTKGDKILRDGQVFQIRGFNLGNWMNLERFMFGFPGVDHVFRDLFLELGGEDKYNAFFDRYYKTYFREEDAKFLKEMGCNTLRVPFNYRRFERDGQPYVYDEGVFEYFDRVIELCRAQDIAVILDYHSAQGFQSGGHCGDNISGEMPFYHDAYYRKRFCALWKHIARRYKDEEMILGYDVMNEPTPADAERPAMCQAYREAIAAIRSVDQNHILILEGAGASYDLSDLDERFDNNMVYSPHIYFMAERFFAVKDRAARRGMVEEILDGQNAVAQKLNVPVYYGETGLSLGPNAEDRLDYLDITLEVCNERGYGWTIWTYKDLWRMGLLSAKDDSPWWNLVRPIFDLKMRYGLDSHANAAKPYADELFAMIDEDFDTEPVDFGYHRSRADQVKNDVWINIVNALGKMLAPKFAKLFADLAPLEMERVVDSFAFENCQLKENWYQIIRDRMQ